MFIQRAYPGMSTDDAILDGFVARAFTLVQAHMRSRVWPTCTCFLYVCRSSCACLRMKCTIFFLFLPISPHHLIATRSHEHSAALERRCEKARYTRWSTDFFRGKLFLFTHTVMNIPLTLLFFLANEIHMHTHTHTYTAPRSTNFPEERLPQILYARCAVMIPAWHPRMLKQNSLAISPSPHFNIVAFVRSALLHRPRPESTTCNIHAFSAIY
jgi:hypothetical protein